MKQAQEEESKRLNEYRIGFGKRWDAIMERRRQEEAYARDERSRQAHTTFIRDFFSKKRREEVE
jgi:hypothetical protein